MIKKLVLDIEIDKGTYKWKHTHFPASDKSVEWSSEGDIYDLLAEIIIVCGEMHSFDHNKLLKRIIETATGDDIEIVDDSAMDDLKET